MSAAPTRIDTVSSWVKVSTFRAYAAGTVMSAAKRTRSIPIITGRLSRNSIHGPSGTASAAPTASPADASADTAAGPACSTRTAISGKDSKASQVPSALIPYAVHSHPNGRPSFAIRKPPRQPRVDLVPGPGTLSSPLATAQTTGAGPGHNPGL